MIHSSIRPCPFQCEEIERIFYTHIRSFFPCVILANITQCFFGEMSTRFTFLSDRPASKIAFPNFCRTSSGFRRRKMLGVLPSFVQYREAFATLRQDVQEKEGTQKTFEKAEIRRTSFHIPGQKKSFFFGKRVHSALDIFPVPWSLSIALLFLGISPKLLRCDKLRMEQA